jgi:hypothetical protein
MAESTTPNRTRKVARNIGWDKITYDDILHEIVRQTLTETSLPNEYPAVVKKLIKHDDVQLCTIDPFYSKTIENNRISNGIATIGGISKKITALVVVPPLIEDKGYDEHMIRIDVSDAPRITVKNEVILIKFLDAPGLENPVFVKYPQKYPITLVTSLDKGDVQKNSKIWKTWPEQKK